MTGLLGGGVASSTVVIVIDQEEHATRGARAKGLADMRLAEFIPSNIEAILAEWEAFARGTAPGAAMDSLALRASVLRLWRDSRPRAHESDVEDVTRFNESLDQSITKAVSSYTQRVEQSRDLFLAILGHDLRNPLNSIAMSAALLGRTGEPGGEATGVASQIARNASVMARMIGDLLDYTRTRLGVGMPVSPTSVDLGDLCRDLFNEFRTAHPTREMTFACEGDVTGHWDADRLRQADSNLMGNAVQHGDPRAAVDLKLSGEASDVVIVVHSGGPPIPPGELSKIFDPLVRGSGSDEPLRHRAGSIGLGLYIAREIARSHGGRIDVASSAPAGTTFTVRLPRHLLTRSGQAILDEAHIQNM
jgi:signal transduction histidine kinase